MYAKGLLEAMLVETSLIGQTRLRRKSQQYRMQLRLPGQIDHDMGP